VDHKLLSIYLNDHLAGASGGRELAARAAGSNKGTEYGDFLERLLAEIEDDRAALVEVMRRLDIGEDRLKQAAAWAAEKAGRLKLNGRVLGYSPLSRLIELDGLHIGINGKIAAWTALKQANVKELAGFDLDRLIERAERQLSELEPFRRDAAAAALAEDADTD
jgi:hypothetical protein